MGVAVIILCEIKVNILNILQKNAKYQNEDLIFNRKKLK